VTTHLGHAYEKLNIAGREQLANAFANYELSVGKRS
jgi:DNA-binding CsgD family transcriptional regulator